jgi:hypothetical protein
VRTQGLGALSATSTVEPRREYARIVHYQKVVRSQQVRQFAKCQVFPPLRRRSSIEFKLPILIRLYKVKQARTGSIDERLLRYAFRRQLIVKIRNEHRRDYMFRR